MTIQELSVAMSEAAAESFYTCERFGQYSPGHEAMRAQYRIAKDRYEAACKLAGVAAYATYDAD